MDFSKEEAKEAAGTLATIRMMLETVPLEILEEVVKTSEDQASRFQALGPLLDPTDYIRSGNEKVLNWKTQIDSARKLIELKKIWRQDVPLEKRIQEELDQGAPKEVEHE